MAAEKNLWERLYKKAEDEGCPYDIGEFVDVVNWCKSRFTLKHGDDQTPIKDKDLETAFADWKRGNDEAWRESEELKGRGKRGTAESGSRTRHRNVALEVDAAEHRKRTSGGMTEDEVFAQCGYKAFKIVPQKDEDNLDDGGFPNGTFYKTVAAAGRGNSKAQDKVEPWDVRNHIVTKTQAEGSGSEGGFITPPLYQNQIMRAAYERFPVLGLRRTFMVATNNVIFPTLADKDRSGGEISGYKLVRTNENTTLTDDTILFEAITFHLSKLAGTATVPNELMEDSVPGFAEVAAVVFGAAVADVQGENYFRGIGVGEPNGIISHSGTYTVSKESSQPADTIKGNNILKMFMRQENKRNCVWIAHHSTLNELYAACIQHKTDAGTAIASAQTLLQQNGQDLFSPTILGKPLYWTEHASSIGDLGDIACVDPQSYIYIMHANGIVIDTSTHVAFTKDQTIFRVRLRDAGRPWRAATVLDRRGFEVSPNVILQAR